MTQIKLRGGWQAEVIEGDGGNDIIIRNPVNPDDLGAGRKFYEVTTIGDKYGAPRLVQEPDLGIPARDAGVDVDGNIVGAIIVRDGQVEQRASFSNLTYMMHSTVEFEEDGEFYINGEARGYIQMLYAPDKNRLVGWVAFVGVDKPDQVKVLEMEEAALLLLDS